MAYASPVLRFDFNNGTNGNSIATSDTPSSGDTAFNGVTENPGSGGVVKYSSSFTAHGTLSMRNATGATSIASYVSWNTAGTNLALYCRYYIYLPTGTTFSARWDHWQPRDSATRIRHALNTSRQLQAVNGSTVVATATSALPYDTWIRVEGKLVISATVGIIELKYFTGDSETATETLTATGLNTGTTEITNIRIGNPFAAANIGPVYFDDLAIAYTDYLGPAVLSSVVTGTTTAAGSVTGSSAATSGTVSGTATASGSAAAARADSGDAAGVATAISSIAGVSASSGSASGTANASASATAARADSGAAAGATQAVGTTSGARADAGSVTGQSNGVGTVVAARSDAATVTGGATASANAAGARADSGAAFGSAVASGVISATSGTVATATGTSVGTGSVAGIRGDAGVVAGAGVGSGLTVGLRVDAGSITGNGAGAAVVAGVALGASGSAAGVVSALAAVAGARTDRGDVAGTAIANGLVTGHRSDVGTVSIEYELDSQITTRWDFGLLPDLSLALGEITVQLALGGIES